MKGSSNGLLAFLCLIVGFTGSLLYASCKPASQWLPNELDSPAEHQKAKDHYILSD